jgi:hypothetical protein
MVKMEESLSRTSSGIQISIHGTLIPHGELVYWCSICWRWKKAFQDLLWYPGEQPWYTMHDIMVYWNIPYGEDGRKPVQDLLWYPGEQPWYTRG